MIPIMDFQKRTLTGPVMKADEFDLAFSSKLRELVAKYQIKYNPEEFVVDDKMADRVFQAGVELLADIGLYQIDTQRVIQYTKEEILEIASERKKTLVRLRWGREMTRSPLNIEPEKTRVPQSIMQAQPVSLKKRGLCRLSSR